MSVEGGEQMAREAKDGVEVFRSGRGEASVGGVIREGSGDGF